MRKTFDSDVCFMTFCSFSILGSLFYSLEIETKEKYWKKWNSKINYFEFTHISIGEGHNGKEWREYLYFFKEDNSIQLLIETDKEISKFILNKFANLLR